MFKYTFITFLKFLDTICKHGICNNKRYIIRKKYLYSSAFKIIDINAAIDILTRYESMKKLSDKIKNSNDIFVYYAINNDFYLEYGFISKSSKNIINKFKINKHTYNFIKKYNFECLKHIKLFFNRFSYNDLYLLLIIIKDLFDFYIEDIKYYDIKVKINNDLIEYIILLNEPNDTNNIKCKIKNEFNIWVVDKKWVDKILYKVNIIKNKAILTIKLKDTNID